MANSVDPDEMPHSAASHLGLHCLLRPVCLNTYGKYSNQSIQPAELFTTHLLDAGQVHYFDYLLMCLKNCWMGGNDQMPCFVASENMASDLGQ